MNTKISAWMTHHDVPMLYLTFEEAAAYCDDDEPPIPLYTKPQPAKPEAVRLRDELRERTPSSLWADRGFPDPHGDRYACERAALAMGDLSDDELANAVFMHGDKQPSIADLVAGKAFLPLAYLTAAKDRIRWLSRALVAAQAALAATGKQQVGEVQGVVTDAQIEHAMRAYAKVNEDNGEPQEFFPDAMHAALLAALAARQPAGQVVGYVSRDSSKAHMCVNLPEGSPLYALAARQPVGNGWSGWATQKLGHMPKLWGTREIAELNHDLTGDTRLIFLSEQPAQAVDLGQKVVVPSAGEYESDLQRQRDYAAGWNAYRAALIDGGKAVGNG